MIDNVRLAWSISRTISNRILRREGSMTQYTVWKRKIYGPWQLHGGRYNEEECDRVCEQLRGKGWITQRRVV